MHSIYCVPLLSRKPLVKNTLFKSFPEKRSDCDTQKSSFGFDPKNPTEEWILWIHDPFLDFPKKTQHPDLDFPKKNTALSNHDSSSQEYGHLRWATNMRDKPN